MGPNKSAADWQEANKEDKKDKPGGTTEVQNELHNQGREEEEGEEEEGHCSQEEGRES